MIVHANLIATRIAGFWRGVLIEGPSGCGKSDLSLRAIDAGFRLIADDRVLLWVSGGQLYGRAPETLHSLLEIRGLDVMAEPALPFAAVSLVLECAPNAQRMPEPQAVTRMGLALPALTLAPLEGSAPAKLLRALEHLGARR